MGKQLAGFVSAGLGAGIVLIALVAAAPAQAVGIDSPYFTWATGAANDHDPAIMHTRAADAATSTTAQVLGATSYNFPTSVSTDGRVFTYVRSPLGKAPTADSIRVIVRIDGHDAATLAGITIPPIVSADGATVTYVKRARIRILDTATLTTATSCAVSGSLDVSFVATSPDGSTFVQMRSKEGKLELVRASDCQVVASTSAAYSFMGQLAWSPDGQSVAGTATFETHTQPTTTGIVTVDLAGRVTRTSFEVAVGSTSGVVEYSSPAWINGRVWALRSVTRASMSKPWTVTTQAVTSSSWTGQVRLVGAPFIDKGDFESSFIGVFGIWSTSAPR